MGAISDQIMNLNIRVQSPDRTVSGRLNMREGMTVEFNSDFRERHTEESLADQIEEALRGLAAGRRRADEVIREQAREGRPPAAPNSRIGRRRIALADALDGIEVSAESPDGYVKVQQIGRDRFIVLIRPGALSRLDDRRLTTEVNTAVRSMNRAYGTRGIRLHDRLQQP